MLGSPPGPPERSHEKIAMPSSEHDWTIRAINIHGVFFERWCQKAIADSGTWSVRSTNYAVEFPPPNGPWRGRESALDIRAELRRGDRLLTLLVECKNHNPEFVNWVLFPKYPLPKETTFAVSQVENFPREAPAQGWTVGASLKTVGLTIPVADEARETRGSYAAHQRGDRTKTSNAAIAEAAHQVALAAQAIAQEERGFGSTLGSADPAPRMPWRKQVFLPMVVTSARIFTCDFDPADVDPSTGEIPYAKATLNEWPYLVYEYALPRHLQLAPTDVVYALTRGSMELFARMHILVVHSGKFAEVLGDIAGAADHFLQ